MSPFPDDLEVQLRRAAHDLHAGRADAAPPPRRPSGAWRRGVRALPLVLAGGVTLAVAIAVLVLVGHGRSGPTSGPAGGGSGLPRPTGITLQEYRYIERASRSVAGTPPCLRRSPAGPRFVGGQPGPALRSVLGVLRRPAIAADRIRRSDLPDATEIYRGAIRRARVADGVTYWIVPTAGAERGIAPSAGCFDAERAALRHELPQIPARLRAPTLALQARLIAVDVQSLRPHDTICLVLISHNVGGYGCGTTAAGIRDGGLLAANGDVVDGLAPDGVATVTVSYRASGRYPALQVTDHPVGNVVAITVPGASIRPGPELTVWGSASGQALRRFTGDDRTMFCRENPGACGSYGASSSSSSASATRTATTP